MSTPNTLSTYGSATSPALEGVQPSTNDTNEASQSKNIHQLKITEDEENNPYATKKRKRTSKAWTDFKEEALNKHEFTAPPPIPPVPAEEKKKEEEPKAKEKKEEAAKPEKKKEEKPKTEEKTKACEAPAEVPPSPLVVEPVKEEDLS
ncbi:hypothetical protein Pfo_002153 [Paulownia fortunei]|nr:hypothetical protein Pfo_002153 [Paulownia fortunei]